MKKYYFLLPLFLVLIQHAAFASETSVSSSATAAAEQTHFDVVLTSYGSSKLQVVKALRAELGLRLEEAKNLADTVPSTVKEKISQADAEKLKLALEAAGASVQIKPSLK